MLTTERLHLRPVATGDAAALLHLFADPDVMRYGEGPQTAGWVDSWIAWVRRTAKEKGYAPLAVIPKSSESLIGYCGLFHFPDINGRPEIELGYRLIQSAWGQGYATEAATAVRDHAFNALAIPRLVSLIDPANTASIAVAKKLGMTYTADVMLAGYTHPDHLYVIEKTAPS